MTTETLQNARIQYASRLEDAARLQAEAKAAWVATVRDAVAQSSISAVARELGVSRQRVAELVR